MQGAGCRVQGAGCRVLHLGKEAEGERRKGHSKEDHARPYGGLSKRQFAKSIFGKPEPFSVAKKHRMAPQI